jgi:hypothetical protein
MLRQDNISSVSVIKDVYVGCPAPSLVLFKNNKKTNKHKERRAVPEVSETLQQCETDFCKTHERKEKLTLEQATKAQRGRRCTALLFL